MRPLLLTLLLACARPPAADGPTTEIASATPKEEGTKPAAPPGPGQEQAIFAGGCFWCTESDLEKVEGVISVESGYVGGPEQAPTYEQVSSHRTGHAEAVRVIFDPTKVTYAALTERFWRTIDPFQVDGQFCDRGHQYRSALFPLDEAQRAVAEASKAAMDARFEEPIATSIETPGTFWLAEDYHQDFYKNNPTRYYSYRLGCGRDARTAEIWGDEAAGH